MRYAFEYALLRVVPHIERGERLNAGVILYCRALDHLGAAAHLDPARLAALDPTADPVAVGCVLDAIVAQCAVGSGGARYAGPAGTEDRGRRFRRLTAPRSTAVQPGPVHTGLTTDPHADLIRLLDRLVR